MVLRTRLLLVGALLVAALSACVRQPPPAPEFGLTVTVDGNGVGDVTSDPAGIDTTTGDVDATFADGTVVTLTAFPASGSFFEGYTPADVCGVGSTAETCVVTMDAAVAVTATFSIIVFESLSVTVAAGGAAAGAVTSDPPGIDTALGTNTADFPVGSTVALTAAATAGGFAGWTGGDCDGLKTLECVVTMDDGEPAVTANFNDVVALTVRVGAGTDDAVEFLTDSVSDPAKYPAGYVWADWPRFFVGFDEDHAQTEAGVRFPAVTVPAGANVLEAALQLSASAVGGDTGTEGDFTLAIRGQLATTAAGFPQDPNGGASFGITGRTERTVATTNWNISEVWTADGAYQSPDIGAVVREIVNLPAWNANDTIVLFLSNVDPLNVEARRVWSFDGVGAGDDRLPTLLIEYVALP